ncbi:hypothetical protein cyc_08687 [Cyclospora cayetanensis]|uniref:Uncharacterized protein n=1 Tax=Cyclospora cayetanensis TaxID=88456 RepID=A0A1D3CTZ7_9EIME|nr:hypothetical protein cyc_08687 [Cyclospora cayetanensis]
MEVAFVVDDGIIVAFAVDDDGIIVAFAVDDDGIIVAFAVEDDGIIVAFAVDDDAALSAHTLGCAPGGAKATEFLAVGLPPTASKAAPTAERISSGMLWREPFPDFLAHTRGLRRSSDGVFCLDELSKLWRSRERPCSFARRVCQQVPLVASREGGRGANASPVALRGGAPSQRLQSSVIRSSVGGRSRRFCMLLRGAGESLALLSGESSSFHRPYSCAELTGLLQGR